MPIKPENRARYPKNWQEIRTSILDRAGHRCEFCGIENYVYKNTKTGVTTTDEMQVEDWTINSRHKVSKIILTIAHLDHTPENNDPDNLKALCQKCHNDYDRPHRLKNSNLTRARKRKGVVDLFHDSAV